MGRWACLTSEAGRQGSQQVDKWDATQAGERRIRRDPGGTTGRRAAGNAHRLAGRAGQGRNADRQVARRAWGLRGVAFGHTPQGLQEQPSASFELSRARLLLLPPGPAWPLASPLGKAALRDQEPSQPPALLQLSHQLHQGWVTPDPLQTHVPHQPRYRPLCPQVAIPRDLDGTA